MARDFLILPVFIPHAGCPYRCVFCDQNKITGAVPLDFIQALEQTLSSYFCGNPARAQLPARREAAFYGGAFTGLPLEQQERLLAALQPWIDRGLVHAARVSTHPACIDETRLQLLKRYRVETIELGVQSTDSAVLKLSGRDYDLAQIARAAGLIRQSGFKLGVQLMPGLPADTAASFAQTVADSIALRPDFARIYPALVIRGTALFAMYQRRQYEPWDLEATIEALKTAILRFRAASIPVIRVGLHPDPSLLANYVAGPLHPALGHLIDCRIGFDELTRLIEDRGSGRRKTIVFRVPANRISVYVGHKRENANKLRALFGFEHVIFEPIPGNKMLELAS